MKTSLHNITVDRDNGFTLIEVLISLAILSIGLLAVASLQVTASLQNRNSLDISEASAVASYQMESLMELAFDSSELDTTNTHSPSSESMLYGKYNIPQDQFNIQWTVTDIDLNNDSVAETKSIILSVTRISSQRKVDFVFFKHNDLRL